ncbi:MAG: precorrin-2 dehydrogenase/sirohydrochlorin ferrochelatase family protein [Vulcanimicrobiaceae bacterium]
MNLEGRDCIVIGPANDREAVEKTRALEEVGASVRWIQDGSFRDEDVAQAFFVISTPLDEALSARLRRLADRYHFLLCCIDQPAYGFVAMQAVAKAGPARITVSSGGVSPAVSKRWRIAIQRVLDGKFTRFLDALRTKRTANRDLPDSEARKQAGRDAAEGFDVQISVRYPDWFESGPAK